MSYEQQRDVLVAANNALLSTPGSVFWAPGYQPVVLKAAAIIVTTAVTVASGVVTINKRPTAGSATGAIVIDTITVPITAALGDVIYVDGLDTKISPGEEIEFAGDGGGTVGAGHVVAFIQPAWENPANNTNMTKSA